MDINKAKGKTDFGNSEIKNDVENNTTRDFLKNNKLSTEQTQNKKPQLC